MPKSKRRPPHRKEKKYRATQSTNSPAALTAQSSTAPQQYKSAPSMSTRTPLTTTGAARHPYVSGELKRIGILTGIVLVLLIILAIALPRFI